MAGARLFVAPNLEALIKEYFYNTLVGFVLEQGDYTPDNLDQKLIQGIVVIIRDIFEQSKECSGVRLPSGVTITVANCPAKYKKLFDLLISLKERGEPSLDQLTHIVQQITKFESFQDLNPTQNLLEMAGYVQPVLTHVQYDTTNITAELIRDSFYNEMVTQGFYAVENGWLTADDIDDKASQIYIVLPALTILEAILQSVSCDGVRLLKDKVLTNENCPDVDALRAFTAAILAIKLDIREKCKQLTSDQIGVVRHMLASEVPMPAALAAYKTPQVVEIVGRIKGMAIEVSRQPFFHAMSEKVIACCSESLCQAPARAAV